MFVVFRV